ncbi:MAG: GDYXXLXY domain-containing protein, partial [Planctomycetaceae bacterium]|nr:GDYXXLXY domain-containing protein [Planctomycetaceae bacterium]
MSNPQSDNVLAQFRQKLYEESQRWTEENLLTPEQRNAILQRYEVVLSEPLVETSPMESVKEFPLYVRVVLALAVVLVGLAVFLLISFNWKHLDGASKLGIVGTVLAVSHLGGFRLRKSGWKNWADGAFFFAGIMYGVGIWQIGQVFHLPADYPMGLWLWAFGAFPLALAVGSTPLHLLSVALLVSWVIAAQTGFLNLQQVFWFGIVPFSALSLPLFAAVGISVNALQQKKFAATLYVFLLGFWWILQGQCSGLGPHLTLHIVFIGLIYVAAASWRFRNIDNAALERAGVLLIADGLIAPSFLNYWGWLLAANVWNHPRIADEYFIVYLFWVFILPAFNFLFLLGLVRLRNQKENLLNLVRNNRIVITLAIVIFVLWVGSYAISSATGQVGRYYFHSRDVLFENPLVVCGMLAVNAIIFILAIRLIVVGLRQERSDSFWSGVMFFLLWAIVRYVDLFSGIGGMLGAAAIFMFCGLFMLGIVYVWTTRRHKFRITEPIAESPPEFIVPLWLEAIGSRTSRLWQSERRVLTAVIVVALLQFGILGAMITNEMRPHVAAAAGTGTTIQVLTAPVDPRDMFRGDYVILRYEFSNATGIPGQRFKMVNNRSEQTVFVTMKQEGELWKAV